MWKRDSGNWQERLQRVPQTPRSPEVVSAPSLTVPRSFLAEGFKETHPRLHFPSVKETATAGTNSCEAGASHPWVTFCGVGGEYVMNLRARLDALVGHTVAHYVPTQEGGRAVYVCFEKIKDAESAVRQEQFLLHWEPGIAASMSLEIEGGGNVSHHSTVEVDALWCRDESFLGSYGRLVSLGEHCSSQDLEAGITDKSSCFTHSDSLPITALVYSRSENLWYELVRLLLLLWWCGFRFLLVLVGKISDDSVQMARWHEPAFSLIKLAGWSSSPIQYLTYWIASRVPFAPSVAEVDLVLWSFGTVRSAHPQRALAEFAKQPDSMQRFSKRNSFSRSSKSRGISTINPTPLPKILQWKPSYRINRYSTIVGCAYICWMLWLFFP